MYLIGLELARTRETLPPDEIEFILDEVYRLPAKMQTFLDGDHPIDEIAQRFYQEPFFLFLGRHIGLPIALEGALKLKEISYIPTEAYSAGEMKHGPIALLGEGTPVVVVATNIHVYDKIVSNIQESRARGAHVIAIATDGNEDIQHHANDVIYVPKSPAFLQAVLATLPLQLLAYRIARLRGAERRPAAQPREDRHGRVAPLSRSENAGDSRGNFARFLARGLALGRVRSVRITRAVPPLGRPFGPLRSRGGLRRVPQLERATPDLFSGTCSAQSSGGRRRRFVCDCRRFSSSRRSRDAAVGLVGAARPPDLRRLAQLLDDPVGRELAVAELRALVLGDRAHDRAEPLEHAPRARRRSAPPSPRRRRAPRRGSSSSARAARPGRSNGRTGTRLPTE